MQILTILILLGAIQGFISSALLFKTSKGNLTANKILAVLILLLSLACFNLFLLQSDFRNSAPWANVAADVLPLLIVMPIGPLIFFYVKSHLPETTPHSWDYRNFYTVIIDLIPYIAGTLLHIGLAFSVIIPAKENAWRNFIDVYFVYSDLPRWLSLSVYLYLSFRLFRKHKTTAGPAAPWIIQFIVVFTAFQTIWLLHLIPYLLPPMREPLMNLVDWYPLYIPLVALVYWLGVNGYMRSLETHFLKNSRKTGTSPISKQIQQQTIEALINAMEIQKLYLNPDLNLDLMVKQTGIPQKMISAVLNQHLSKSFNEFVNEYRVKELTKKLVDPGYDHFTIMGLALECGFNSQATMQRSFKQVTGSAPKEYRQDFSRKILAQNPEKISHI
jgi:AraC-like DNA-binding protein